MVHPSNELARAGNPFVFLFTVLAALSCADLLGFEAGQLRPDDGGKSAGGSSSGGSSAGGSSAAGSSNGGAGGAAGTSRAGDASDDRNNAGSGGRGGTADASRDSMNPPDARVDAATTDVVRPDASIDTSTMDGSGGGGPTDAPSPTCNPTSCPTGCCDSSDRCVTSPNNTACGTAGGPCTVCAIGQACSQGACRCGSSCTTGCCTSTGECLTPSDQACGAPGGPCTACASGQTCDATGKCACTPASCPNGCCDTAGTCVPYTGQNKDKCGTAGMCGPCSAGQACGATGACECTPGSCPGGCCNGTACVLIANQGTMQCGTGGNACGSCVNGQACTDGACSCGGVTCAGCCSGSQCQMSDHSHCGAGGGRCTGCDAKQECNAQGLCVCTAASCPNGCCDANEQCIETGTIAACGTGGDKCKMCEAGLACNAGKCTCTPSSCTGCCTGSVCVGGSAATACGTGGEMCQTCEQGQRCNGIDCVCDPTSCSGCCNNLQQCKTTSKDTCGSTGAPCQACAPGLECNGTGCVCTPSSCTTGCCVNGTTCLPFAQQSDTQCGAAKACGSCAATMQSCDKANGQCTCTAASCSNGCCSGTTCRPYADQDMSACGVPGACTTCGSGQKCNGSGACVPTTWCDLQTIPVGVAVADYQCVDFDTGVYPSAWTLTQLGGGTDAISMTQASSPPYSYDAAPFGTVAGIDVARTLSWSKSGTAVTRMDLTADIFRIQSKGDPGPWTGHSDLLCAGFGSTKACLYYAGSAGFGVAYATTGTTRVDCGHIMDLTPGGWNHIELQISSSGSIFLWSNGRVETNCNDGGIGFPSSNIGTVTVGVAQIGETLPLEHYFDNIIAVVRR